MAKRDKYPKLVCYNCAVDAGGRKPYYRPPYEKGTCGVCKKTKLVVDPSAFAYPEFSTVSEEVADEEE